MIHIYTGDGKGKTTAAMGLAMRAAGCGKRVLVTQFLKGGPTGELQSLHRLGIPVLRNRTDHGFFATLSEAEKQDLTQEQNDRLNAVLQSVLREEYDLIVLDELLCACSNGSADCGLAERILNTKTKTELVLTGRNAPPFFLLRADYVTVMQKEKHPYDRGIPAREGIEY